ncbi:MAG: hypothetical protein IJW09_00665 [Clostridia bacterium]|jgi:hypothetical protein|nr:hypothetical protein [Clostridia bacterium]
MGDIFCRVVELPHTVNAVTVIDSDGNFNVYVNALLSIEEQRRAFDHEKRHILKDHFYSHKPVEECEDEAKG